MSRLLLVAPPFAGHLFPLVALGRRLRERGFDVGFATAPGGLPVLRALGFRADPILADHPEAFDQIANTSRAVGHNPLRLVAQLRQNLALLPAARRELDALLARDAPAVVLADFTAPVAGWAAQAAGTGWITTIPTPFAIESATGTPSYCGGWSEPTRAWHHARDAAGRLAVRGFKLAVGAAFARELAALGTGVYRTDGSEAVYSPTCILGLGVAELEFARTWPAAFHLVGPVTESPVAPVVPAELRRPGRRVLVTLGTHLWWAKDELVRGVRALADRFGGHEFVVTLGKAAAGSAPVPAGGRVLVYDYLPYDEVLGGFEAVIHHGGAGITYSTLRAGLPALVWPHDYDQPDFAARLVARGAALRIRDLTSAATAGALATALSGLPGVGPLQAAVARSDPYAATEAAIAEVIARRG